MAEETFSRIMAPSASLGISPAGWMPAERLNFDSSSVRVASSESLRMTTQ